MFEVTGNYGDDDPAYLSFDVGPGLDRSDLNLWYHDGSQWAEYAAADLTYNGDYASFTVTGFSAAVLGIGDLADRSVPLDECVMTLQRAIDFGLNLIDNVQNAVIMGQFIKPGMKLIGRHDITALPLDGLHKYCRYLLGRHRRAKKGVLDPLHAVQSAFGIGQVVSASIAVSIGDMSDAGN